MEFGRAPTPGDSGDSTETRDVVAFQIVTVGDEILSQAEGMMKGGEYSEGFFLHRFTVRLAEAAPSTCTGCSGRISGSSQAGA